MLILDGKKVSEEIASSLKEVVSRLEQKPKLLIIQVGENTASEIYIKRKRQFAEDIGMVVDVANLSKDSTTESVLELIDKANKDSEVHGIIIQLPIPQELDKRKILDFVAPEKDVDGLGLGRKNFVPATTKGIMMLLKWGDIKISGQKVVIINDSELIGQPTADFLSKEDAEVIICNDQTADLPSVSKTADILITAIGQPEIIDDSYLSDGQTVVDVGITRTPDGIRGDVKREIQTDLKALTPVPGGVGPMTVASLFENLLLAYNMQDK